MTSISMVIPAHNEGGAMQVNLDVILLAATAIGGMLLIAIGIALLSQSS